MCGSTREGIRGGRGMWVGEKEMKEKVKEKIGCHGHTRALDT
jgi:hypothetical protein